MEGQHWQLKPEPIWSAEKVAQACNITEVYGSNVEIMWPILYQVSTLYNIAEPAILAGLCGVIGHETAGRWWPIHEFGTNFSQYGYAPTGADYGGRGLIQTTWASNYQVVRDYLAANFNIQADTVNNPDLLYDPTIAAHAACIYWVTHNNGVILTYCRNGQWAEVQRQVLGAYNTDYTNKVIYAASVLL